MHSNRKSKKTAAAMAAAATAPTVSADNSVDDQEIARLAHSYWETRGCPDGSAEEDWFRAEREWKARQAAE